MKIYVVGGAVRDELLGLPIQDRDYVVVGATPEVMLAKGFKPVGKDFPVFLHPQTHEEYALARTERKSGHGYQGFAFFAAPEVSLEEDLARRDLTINAIAYAIEPAPAQNQPVLYIDPFHGRADLAARVLRHVSPAFVEDPVRILRIARFSARFTDFSIAPETLALMRVMSANGEVDHLVAERVWQEMAKGLMEEKPSRLFSSLRDCGALARLLPELDQLFGVEQRADFHPEIDTGVHVLMALDYAAAQKFPLPVRFAVLLHDLGKALTPAADLPRHPGHEERGVALVDAVCTRLKVPSECRDLAQLMVRYHGDIRRAGEMRANTLVKFLGRLDALRKPERFMQLIKACHADYHGRLGFAEKPSPDTRLLFTALEAMRQVNAGQIAKTCADPAQIPERIYVARVHAVKEALGTAASEKMTSLGSTTENVDQV